MSEALIVVDLQKGFDDPSWGRRNNPACEENVAAVIEAFRRRGEPIVFVRHDSDEDVSPLRPDEPGNAFREEVHGTPDLLVTKQSTRPSSAIRRSRPGSRVTASAGSRSAA